VSSGSGRRAASSVNATIASSGGNAAGTAKAIVSSTLEVVMPLGGLIDPVAEKARLAKEIEKAQKEIGTLEKKLGNADFVAKAPEDVVAEQKARLAEEKSRAERLIEALKTVESAQ